MDALRGQPVTDVFRIRLSTSQPAIYGGMKNGVCSNDERRLSEATAKDLRKAVRFEALF